jgi:hypothetical protein
MPFLAQIITFWNPQAKKRSFFAYGFSIFLDEGQSPVPLTARIKAIINYSPVF